MSSLAEQLAAATAAGKRAGDLRVGVAVETETGWLLNVGGASLEAWWPADYVPTDGEPVTAALIGETWHVLGSHVPAPVLRPIVGRVKTVPSGATRITVTVGGQDMELGFLSTYTPVVGHDVALLWQAGFEDPLVLGRRGSTPVPVPPKDPEAPKPVDPTAPSQTSGRDTFTATTTGTWDVGDGQWSRFQGANVTAGTWAGRSSEGFWFYGTKIRNTLRGATVTKAEIYLPNRLRMGSYNSPATAVLQRHTADTRPTGRPSKTGTTTTITVPKIGTTLGWVEIPAEIAQALIDTGGGITSTGTTYLGFPGVGSGTGRNPQSGALRISWEKN